MMKGSNKPLDGEGTQRSSLGFGGPKRGRCDTVFKQISVKTTEDLLKDKKHYSHGRLMTWTVAISILINAVMIGVEIDTVPDDALIVDRLLFFVANLVFTLIFIVEMFAKLSLDGWNYFLDPWNVMDYHLVVLGFVDIVAGLIMSDAADMNVLLAFRMLRMLRVVRQIRLLRMFRDLWTIVKGFYDSIITVMWVSVLLGFVVYSVAVILVILVGQSQKDFIDGFPDVDIYTGTVPRAMLTVFQVITLDSWSESIVRPIAARSTSMTIIFIAMIMLATFGIMNVIIGVIVERTLKVSQENDASVKKIVQECAKRVMVSMKDEFMMFAEKTETGELSFEQFVEVIETTTFQNKLKILGLPSDDAEELFFLLDVDGSQTLSVDEFVNGIQKIKGLAQGADMIQLLAYVQRASRKAMKLQHSADSLIRHSDALLERLDDMWGITESELHEREFSILRQKQLAQKVHHKEQLLSKIAAGGDERGNSKRKSSSGMMF